jgi:hypothetical protein
MSACDRAIRRGERFFYDGNTIRSCPENRCVAVRRDGKWVEFGVAYGDRPIRERGSLFLLIDKHKRATPKTLIRVLSAHYGYQAAAGRRRRR